MARQRKPHEAQLIGQALAEQALKRRRKVAKARKAAIAAHAVPLTRKITASGAGALHSTMVLSSTSAGVLIAEGDSWFDYPFNDVLSDLDDYHGYDVESAAHKGDTVEDMAYGNGQLDDFSRRIEKVLRGARKPRAILLSGGGNDIAGDVLGIFINHAASSIAGLNDSVIDGVIDQRIKDAYITIIQAVTTLCEELVGETIPIVVHGYDYPVPDGRGVLGGWAFLPGPWLEPGFREKGFNAMATRIAMMKTLIDRFNTMLAAVCAMPAYTHVTYLDLRQTLSTGSNYKDWWANELHPSPKGFRAVSDKFAAVIASLP
ncbi:MAG: SGNH/GDSL hydrolase family protein [Dokdonella sp.]